MAQNIEINAVLTSRADLEAFRDIEKEIAQLERDLKRLEKGIEVDVELNMQNFERDIKRLERDVEIEAKVDLNLQDAETKLKNFARQSATIKAKVDLDTVAASRERDAFAARTSTLKAKVDLDTRDAEARLASFGRNLKATIVLTADIKDAEARINSLSKGRTVVVGVVAETRTAENQINALNARLRALTANNIVIRIDVDTAAALAQIANVQTMVRALSSQDVNIQVDVDSAGAIGALTAVATAAAAIARLRPSIKVDVDAAGAIAGLGGTAAAATATSSSFGMLSMATMGAGAAMGLFSAASAAAMGSLGGLAGVVAAAAAAIAIKAAIVTGAAAAIGMIAAAAVGAVAGLAVLAAAAVALGAAFALVAAPIALLIGDMSKASDAASDGAAQQKQAEAAAEQYASALEGVADASRGVEDAQRSAAEGVASAQKQFVSATEAVADAQRSLGDAHQSAAEGVASAMESYESATRSVGDAERSLADARTSAAEGVANAVESYQRAIENTADAERGLADARRSAAEGVASAVRSYQSAVRSTENAERSLVQAREGAARAARSLAQAQKDLNQAMREEPFRIIRSELDLEQARLDQKRAVMDITAAERELMVARQSGNMQRVREAELNLQQQRLSQRRGALDLRDAENRLNDTRQNGSRELQGARQGVESASEAEKRARQGVADAERNLQDARRNQSEAFKGISKAQQEGTRQIADAQRALMRAQQEQGKSYENISKAQIAGARRIADAERGLADAQRNQAKAYEGIAKAQAQGARRIEDAERNLMKARRAQAEAAQNIAKAQAAGQRQIEAAMRRLAKAQEAVAKAAKNMGAAQQQAAKQSESMWQKLKNAFPILQRLETAFRSAFGPAAARIRALANPIAEVAINALPRLGRASTQTVNAIIAGFNRGANEVRKSGRAFRDYQGILGAIPAVARNMTSAFTKFGAGFLGIMNAAMPFVRQFSIAVDGIATRFLKWTSSEAGRAKIAAFFRTAAPIARALFEAVLRVGGALVDLGIKHGPTAARAIDAIGKGAVVVIRFVSNQLIPAFERLWAAIEKSAQSGGLLNTLWGIAKAVFMGISNAAKAVYDWFVRNWPQIDATFKSTGDGIRAGAERLRPIWDAIVSAATRVVDWFKSVWPSIKHIASEALDGLRNVISFFSDYWKTQWENIKQILSGVWTSITSVIEGAVIMLGGIVKAFLGAVSGDWQVAWDGILQIGKGFWTSLEGAFWGGVEVIKGVGKAIWEAITFPFQKAYDLVVGNSIVPDMVNDILSWIKSLPGKITEALTSVADAIKKPFQAAWDAVSKNSIVPDMVRDVGKHLGRTGAVADNALKDVPAKIKSPFDKAALDAKKAIDALPKTIKAPKVEKLAAPARPGTAQPAAQPAAIASRAAAAIAPKRREADPLKPLADNSKKQMTALHKTIDTTGEKIKKGLARDLADLSKLGVGSLSDLTKGGSTESDKLRKMVSADVDLMRRVVSSDFALMSRSGEIETDRLKKVVTNDIFQMARSTTQLATDMNKVTSQEFTEMQVSGTKQSDTLRRNAIALTDNMEKVVTQSVTQLQTDGTKQFTTLQENGTKQSELLNTNAVRSHTAMQTATVKSMTTTQTEGTKQLTLLQTNGSEQTELLNTNATTSMDAAEKGMIESITLTNETGSKQLEALKDSGTASMQAADPQWRKPVGAAAEGMQKYMNDMLYGMEQVISAASLPLTPPEQFTPRLTGMAEGGHLGHGHAHEDRGGVGSPTPNPKHIVWDEQMGNEVWIAEQGPRDKQLQYLDVAADMFDRRVVPKGRVAHAGDEDQHHAPMMMDAGMAEGGMMLSRLPVDVFAAHGYTAFEDLWDSRTAEIARQTEAATGATPNTYSTHPDGWEYRAPYSIDWWAPGGGDQRGNPIGTALGDEVLSYITSNFASELSYWIWNGDDSWGGSAAAYDSHWNHVHGTFMGPSEGPGGGGGGGRMPNIQPLIDKHMPDEVEFGSAAYEQAATEMGKIARKAILAELMKHSGRNQGPGTGFSGGGDAAANRELGKKMNEAMGWGSHWEALDSLWIRESGWDHLADNPTSDAYGIPQAMVTAHDMPAGFGPPGGDPAVQIDWGLGYIAGRHGDPSGAWAHSESVGWYDNGGIALRPQMAAIAGSGPELMLPLTDPQAASRFLDVIERAQAARPVRTGVTTEAAINQNRTQQFSAGEEASMRFYREQMAIFEAEMRRLQAIAEQQKALEEKQLNAQHEATEAQHETTEAVKNGPIRQRQTATGPGTTSGGRSGGLVDFGEYGPVISRRDRERMQQTSQQTPNENQSRTSGTVSGGSSRSTVCVNGQCQSFTGSGSLVCVNGECTQTPAGGSSTVPMSGSGGNNIGQQATGGGGGNVRSTVCQNGQCQSFSGSGTLMCVNGQCTQTPAGGGSTVPTSSDGGRTSSGGTTSGGGNFSSQNIQSHPNSQHFGSGQKEISRELNNLNKQMDTLRGENTKNADKLGNTFQKGSSELGNRFDKGNAGIGQAIDAGNASTRENLKNLRNEYRAATKELRNEYKDRARELRDQIRNSSSDMRDKLKGELKDLRTEYRDRQKEMRDEFREARKEAKASADKVVQGVEPLKAGVENTALRTTDLLGVTKKVWGLAHGGVVTAPTPAIIGEGGSPEYVISTDPAIRGRSQGLFSELANALGYQIQGNKVGPRGMQGQHGPGCPPGCPHEGSSTSMPRMEGGGGPGPSGPLYVGWNNAGAGQVMTYQSSLSSISDIVSQSMQDLMAIMGKKILPHYGASPNIRLVEGAQGYAGMAHSGGLTEVNSGSGGGAYPWLRNTVSHELGHQLGAAHWHDQHSMMSYYDWPRDGTPSAFDASVLSGWYGAPSGYVPKVPGTTGGYTNGGIAMRPQIARVAESGPELFVPLTDQRAQRVLGSFGLAPDDGPGDGLGLGAPKKRARGTSEDPGEKIARAIKALKKANADDRQKLVDEIIALKQEVNDLAPRVGDTIVGGTINRLGKSREYGDAMEGNLSGSLKRKNFSGDLDWSRS